MTDFLLGLQLLNGGRLQLCNSGRLAFVRTDTNHSFDLGAAVPKCAHRNFHLLRGVIPRRVNYGQTQTQLYKKTQKFQIEAQAKSRARQD